MIVDDEPAVRNVTVRILSALGYAVQTAEDEKQAMKLFERHTFGLVVLEMLLPESSGVEVYRKMRAIKPNLPALFIVRRGLRPVQTFQASRIAGHCQKSPGT